MKSLSRFFCFAILLSFFAAATQAVAQKKDEKDSSKKNEKNSISVKVNVLVLDSNGKPASAIKPGDLRIFEDGIEQKITSIETKENFKLGLVIDNTGSMRTQFGIVISSAKNFVANQRSNDETFVERFVSKEKIEYVQDWTSNKSLLSSKLDDLYVAAGQSAVVDAVYAATKKVSDYSKDVSSRRAIVLISDCEDRDSFYNQKQLLELINQTDIQIFVLGLIDELDKSIGFVKRVSVKERSKELAVSLSSASGGAVFFPRNQKEIADAIIAISTELQSQYLVTYISSNRNRGKKPRKLRAEVTKNASGETRTAFTRDEITIPKE